MSAEQSIGKIVQVIGPVVDVEFEPGKLPSIMNALAVSNPAINDVEGNLIIEVALHLGDNVVRCIAMDQTDGLVRGMSAKDTGSPIMIPVGPNALGRIMNVSVVRLMGWDLLILTRCGRYTSLHLLLLNRIQR